MTVMVGCPVQNRDYILPDYLRHIQNLDFNKKNLHLSFLEDGSTDKTFDILLDFKSLFEDEYYRIDIWRKTSNYEDSRLRTRDYQHFADVRNTWLSMRCPSDEYIFSVDSDVLVSPDTLSRLIEGQKETNANLFSALVYNGFDCYNIANKHEKGYYIHAEPNSKIIPVDVTGACSLITKETLDSGCSFSSHHQGEDCFFCEMIHKKFGENTIYCDAGCVVEHIMEKQ